MGALERHGELSLPEPTRSKLLKMRKVAGEPHETYLALNPAQLRRDLLNVKKELEEYENRVAFSDEATA